MAKKDELVPMKQCREAVYYAARCIQNYINEVRASCYPQTPEEKGGPVYTLFLGHLENIERLLNGDPVEEVVADMKKAGKENDSA